MVLVEVDGGMRPVRVCNECYKMKRELDLNEKKTKLRQSAAFVIKEQQQRLSAVATSNSGLGSSVRAFARLVKSNEHTTDRSTTSEATTVADGGGGSSSAASKNESEKFVTVRVPIPKNPWSGQIVRFRYTNRLFSCAVPSDAAARAVGTFPVRVPVDSFRIMSEEDLAISNRVTIEEDDEKKDVSNVVDSSPRKCTRHARSADTLLSKDVKLSSELATANARIRHLEKLLLSRFTKRLTQFASDARSRIRQRKCRMSEYLETERAYVSDLEIVMRIYYPAISKVVDKASRRKIFRNIGVIAELERAHLDELERVYERCCVEKRLSETEMFETQCGVLTKHLSVLKEPLLSYLESSFESQRVLRKLRNLSKIFVETEKKIIATCDDVKLRDVASFLILPVQIAPRRSLLMRALCKHVPSGMRNRMRRAVVNGSKRSLDAFLRETNAALGRAQLRNVCDRLIRFSDDDGSGGDGDGGGGGSRRGGVEDGTKVDAAKPKGAKVAKSSALRARLTTMLKDNSSRQFICEGELLLRQKFSKLFSTYSLRHVFVFSNVLVILSGPNRTDSVESVQILKRDTAVVGKSDEATFEVQSGHLEVQSNDATTKTTSSNYEEHGVLRSSFWKASSVSEASWWRANLHASRDFEEAVNRVKKGSGSYEEADFVSLVDDDAPSPPAGGTPTLSERSSPDLSHREDTVVTLALSARNLPNKDGFFGLSDGFFVVTDDINGDTIYTSEVIRDNLNPDWKPICLTLSALFGRVLRFKFFDKDPHKRDFLGQFAVSFFELKTGAIFAISSVANEDGARCVSAREGLEMLSKERPTTTYLYDLVYGLVRHSKEPAKTQSSATTSASSDEKKGTSDSILPAYPCALFRKFEVARLDSDAGSEE